MSSNEGCPEIEMALKAVYSTIEKYQRKPTPTPLVSWCRTHGDPEELPKKVSFVVPFIFILVEESRFLARSWQYLPNSYLRGLIYL